MKLSQYSANLEETITGSDLKETNEFYEELYDDFQEVDKFYRYEGTFTVKGDEGKIDCTFEALISKTKGKYHLFFYKKSQSGLQNSALTFH